MEWLRKLLTDWKDALESLNSLAAIAALILGGYWSYRLFVRRRLKLPRADVLQTISHHHLCDNKWLIRVTATVVNKGEVLIEFEQGFTRLLLVRPGDEPLEKAIREGPLPRAGGGSRIEWPCLEQLRCCPNPPREIEPGETDEIHFDFVIDDTIRTVIAHTQLENRAKRTQAFVWERSTVYDLDEKEANASPVSPRKQETEAMATNESSKPLPQGKALGEQTKVDSLPRTVVVNPAFQQGTVVVKPANQQGTEDRQTKVDPAPRPVVRKSE